MKNTTYSYIKGAETVCTSLFHTYSLSHWAVPSVSKDGFMNDGKE